MFDEEWLKRFPLRADGCRLRDQHGAHFKLAGVNWYGASDAFHVVGGLDENSLRNICSAVAAMGFSVVRLPFSNEMLRETEVQEGKIDYSLNPELEGLSPLEIYDEVIDALGRERVAVVLNNHTTLGMWSGGAEANGLWYKEGDEDYTEDAWVHDWITLAQRYADRPHVIGYDLRNEVRPTTYLLGAGPSWNTGDPALDWCRAAGRCARALVDGGAPGLLMIERVCWPQCGLLEMLEPTPPWELWDVPRERIVLAVHMYSWSGPGSWSPKHFTGGLVYALLQTVDYVGSRSLYGEMDSSCLECQLDSEWGFCLDEDICPVWLSEFGCNVNNVYEMSWFREICNYLKKKNADFAYWPLNVGPKSDGGDECYGLLTNDWSPNWFDGRYQILCELLSHESRSSKPLFVSARASGNVASGLAEAPFCAPLPGPLAEWPEQRAANERENSRNDAELFLFMEDERLSLPVPSRDEDSNAPMLPSARYIFSCFEGYDADSGNDARVEYIDEELDMDILEYHARVGADIGGCGLDNLKQICVEGGFGGFAISENRAFMRQATSGELRTRMQSGFPSTYFFLCEEVRLCAISAETCKLDEDTGSSERSTGDVADVAGSLPDVALVRIGLEVFPDQDAYAGADALVLHGASFADCRRRCLERGFGGFSFSSSDGSARFRTASGAVLRRRLEPAADPSTSFYVLTAQEVTRADLPALGLASKTLAEDVPSRQAVLDAVLPELFCPATLAA